jgi:acyl carrier protein
MIIKTAYNLCVYIGERIVTWAIVIRKSQIWDRLAGKTKLDMTPIVNFGWHSIELVFINSALRSCFTLNIELKVLKF